jgi:hypothetical protein
VKKRTPPFSNSSPFGRWHRHKDLNWYKKQAGKSTDDNLDQEIEEMKRTEALALAQALNGGGGGGDAWTASEEAANPNEVAIGERKPRVVEDSLDMDEFEEAPPKGKKHKKSKKDKKEKKRHRVSEDEGVGEEVKEVERTDTISIKRKEVEKSMDKRSTMRREDSSRSPVSAYYNVRKERSRSRSRGRDERSRSPARRVHGRDEQSRSPVKRVQRRHERSSSSSRSRSPAKRVHRREQRRSRSPGKTGRRREERSRSSSRSPEDRGRNRRGPRAFESRIGERKERLEEAGKRDRMRDGN